MYIYIYIYIHVCIYIYMYIHTHTRKGTNGVSANGVTAMFMSFDRGTFWVIRLTYVYLPKSARA